MDVYVSFAPLYTRAGWPHFSQTVAELLPDVLSEFGLQPETALDVACGEGTFAVAMAQAGRQMTGVDRSAHMLRFAQAKADAAGVQVEFLCGDMRELAFEERFDLATCWFDSLNYLLEEADLERTFAGVYRALRQGGAFIFDMNTICGLGRDWQRYPTSVQEDTDEFFVVIRSEYDWEVGIATARITGFVRDSGGWQRIDETHRERGYRLQEIRHALAAAGFRERACWGNLRERSELRPDSSRVWFVVEKPG